MIFKEDQLQQNSELDSKYSPSTSQRSTSSNEYFDFIDSDSFKAQ
jgi:hypothetical protein